MRKVEKCWKHTGVALYEYSGVFRIPSVTTCQLGSEQEMIQYSLSAFSFLLAYVRDTWYDTDELLNILGDGVAGAKRLCSFCFLFFGVLKRPESVRPSIELVKQRFGDVIEPAFALRSVCDS